MALRKKKHASKKFLVKVIIKNFFNKERCGSCKTKEYKRLDQKIKLVDKIKKNIRQPKVFTITAETTWNMDFSQKT